MRLNPLMLWRRDIFPLGDSGKYVAIASLYNWAAGGYYTNEWFLGTIADSKTMTVEDRGLLDCKRIHVQVFAVLQS